MTESSYCRLRIHRRSSDTFDNHYPAAADQIRPNLFARLTPHQASILHSLAVRLAEEQLQHQDPNHDSICRYNRQYKRNSAWHVEPFTTAVEFLPLSIKLADGTAIFVSYNGGNLTESDGNADNNVIDLPSGLARMIPSDEVEVSVQPLPYVVDAKKLVVEPLTDQDWLLLEAHVDWLENGGLLQQVSIVFANQILPIRLGKRLDIEANVRILTSNFQTEDDVWTDDNIDDDSSHPPCVRLVADSQVIIQPEKKQKMANGTTAKCYVFPARQEYGSGMNELADRLGISHENLASVLPCSAVLHPTMLSRLSVLSSSEKSISPSSSSTTAAKKTFAILCQSSSLSSSTESSVTAIEATVQISTSENIPMDHIVLDPLVRMRLRLKLFTDQVSLQLISQAEVEQRTAMLTNLVECGKARIDLRPVQAFTGTDGRFWRYPNVSKAHDEECTSSYVSEKVDISRITFPLEIGSILRLPTRKYNNNSCNRSNLYQLVVEWLDEEDAPSNCASRESPNLFVQGRDLSALLLRCNACFSSTRDNVCTIKLPSPLSPCLIDPLRSTTIFPSTLLTSAQISSNECNVLITGESGSGKTQSALVLAGIARLMVGSRTVYLDCKSLRNKNGIKMTDILFELSQAFQDAAIKSPLPCLLILDDLDEIAPSFEHDVEGNNIMQQDANPMAIDQSKLIADEIRFLIRCSHNLSVGGISIIVTCGDITSLARSILRSCSFGSPVQLPILNCEERQTMYWRLIKLKTAGNNVVTDSNSQESFSLVNFGRKTEGFRPRDIEFVASRVCQLILSRNEQSSISLTSATEEVLESFVPLGQLAAGAEQTTSCTWSEIGGLYQVKEELTEIVLRPSQYKRIYDKANVRLPRGILLFGPPGCGKSYVIPALARECGFPLIMCRGPELLDKYIGASEAKIRGLFSRASAAAPSIIFLDEIDSLAPRRGSDHTGVTDRIVNQLLTLLDGVEDCASKGTIYVVAATSRPEKIDPALLRPGRLERHIYVGHSQGENEWTDLLTKIARQRNVTEHTMEYISSGQFMQNALKTSPHIVELSAADVKALFNTAHVIAVHEAIATGKTNDMVLLRVQHLIEALRKTHPSLSKAESARLQNIYAPFRKDTLPRKDFEKNVMSTHVSKSLRTALH